MPEGTCTEPDCDQPVAIVKRGLCKTHYGRWWKAQAPKTPCAIPGCEKSVFSRGWCRMHYERVGKYGDPDKVRGRWDDNRIDRTQSKTCDECGEPFYPPLRTSHKQWAAQRFCNQRCGNAYRARGGARKLGGLSCAEMGQVAYVRERNRRRAMPRWALWWEEQRRAEDLADLAALLCPAQKGPACRLSKRPVIKQYIAGTCPRCGASVVVKRGWWNDSIRCTACTKARWRGTHRHRAKIYGAIYDESVIPLRVFESDRWICQLCGRRCLKTKRTDLRSATLDHIVPLSRGGDHTHDNVQTACFECNMKKGVGAANDQLRFTV